MWILGKIANPMSIVAGLVANIPMVEGGKAVEAWLQRVKDASGGVLPKGLIGARQNIINGDLLSEENFPEAFIPGV